MLRILREFLLQIAAVAAFVAAYQASALALAPDGSASFASLTLGATLAATLLGGPRLAIGTFLAGWLCFSASHPPLTAVVLAASQAGLCAAAAWVLRRRKFDPGLRQPSELATLIAVAIPVVSMLDALIAGTVLTPRLTGTASATLDSASLSWLSRSAANCVGATLVAPAILIASSLRKPELTLRRIAEFAALLAGLFGATIVVPLLADDGGLMWPIAICLATPFVILLVIRYARWGAVAVASVIGSALVLGVAADSHPPTLGLETARMLGTAGLWVMTLALVAMSMLLAVTVAAHRAESDQVAAVAARLKHVVDAARLGFWQFDANWRTVLVNARLADMLGTTEELLVGRPLLDLVSDRIRDDASRQLAAIERGERDRIELELRQRDGRFAWLGLQITRYTEPPGAAHRGYGAVAAVEDLAERRRAEVDRLKLETNMMQAQKLESLGVLAGGLAHDFNNIVMGIRGNAGLLRVRGGGSVETQACADRIEALCQRSTELVATLLAYAGKGDFSMEQVSLPRIVREAIGVTRLAAPANAKFEFVAPDHQPNISADPHHLRQLLVGILANALEALPPIGGTIRVECSQVDEPEGTPKYALLEVSDDGCGMGDATLARVFEPFFSTKALGRGLGMSAALGIARRLGGMISVESGSGLGTSVRMRVPLAGTEEITSGGKKFATTPRRPTAILAESDAGLRELMVAALEIRGFAVSLEREIGAALNTAEERPPGILVAHAGASVLGALDQVRALRARGCDVPIVLTTDQRDSVIIDASDPQTRWLQRPFDVRRLLDALDEATGVRPVTLPR
ncbi:MAG: ATP-binding protein [Phycisphaerae bacterium]|nr:ATP-binding protein [Phycisphaerae bacterium]